MSGIKKKLGIFGSLLLISALAVMALPTTTLATTYPTTLTDDLGREVNIGALPVKIVSLAPSNTEILFALGLADRVVAVTDYCDYPPEALEKETIGGPWAPSIESIVALEPDLVLAEVPPRESHARSAGRQQPAPLLLGTADGRSRGRRGAHHLHRPRW